MRTVTKKASGGATTSRPPGKPQHEPTAKDRNMVEAMAGFGIPADKIALVLGVSKQTLYKHYRGEIERGAATVEAKLAGNLLRLASGSDGTALKATIFALTTRFGWSAYAPPPLPKEEPIGKKAAAQIEAQTAHEDTGWGQLLN